MGHWHGLARVAAKSCSCQADCSAKTGAGLWHAPFWLRSFLVCGERFDGNIIRCFHRIVGAFLGVSAAGFHSAFFASKAQSRMPIIGCGAELVFDLEQAVVFA